MGFLFSSNKKEKIIAVFDIGSGSVGGAIVSIPFDNSKLPVILKSVRKDIKITEDVNINFSSLTKNMISALNHAAGALYGSKAAAPAEIYCVLASPWYISETRIINLEKQKPFLFNKRLANDLLNKEIESLNKTYKDKYAGLKSLPTMIEQQILSVALNGYPVAEPLGKRCKFLEMNMVISLAPELCLDSIRESLSKFYHHTKVNFSSFTLSTYLAVREKYISPDSYLLLDISGEVTDVGVVIKGVLKSVLSFPFGKKTFFKYICTKLNIELRDAEELFKLYSQNNLYKESKDKVLPLFKSIENSWGEAFRNCISTLPKNLVLPGTVFLTADNDIKNWFANVLSESKHIQEMVSDHKCTVISLDGPQFLNMCNVSSGPCDPFLMIESISIMRKMIK